ncbi:glycosyltransferase family 1 protein [Acinetobacter cumulans]|uniref:Glycosyltransferase family 1 protein n=1 Tax=Acinetobacter cumulans TaxID=2136182 RepID=A0A3A8FR17_9GAMM|nr:glycosyltransferase family 1 protein [Acinetobacter cumulans]
MVNVKFLLVSNDAKSILNFRFDLLKEIQCKGYEIHICAPNILASKYYDFFSNNNFICHDIYLDRTSMSFFSELKTLVSLYKLFIRIKPDFVLGYTIKPAIYSPLVGMICGIKNINMLISGLGYLFNDYSKSKTSVKSLLLLKLYALAIRKSNAVIFQNSDDIKLFRENNLIGSLNNIFLVNGSGVNLNKFFKSPLKLDSNKEISPSFLMVARLLKDKGIYEYIEAIRNIKKKYPLAQFGLLGSLDENPLSLTETELETLISENILHYHGYTDNVTEIISQYNVAVLPSYREGVPRSLLEAMAMGRCVITTDAPGCKETVEDGITGFKIKVGSVSELEKAFEELILHPEQIQFMGDASYELVKEKFDVRLVNRNMIEYMGLKNQER